MYQAYSDPPIESRSKRNERGKGQGAKGRVQESKRKRRGEGNKWWEMEERGEKQ